MKNASKVTDFYISFSYFKTISRCEDLAEEQISIFHLSILKVSYQNALHSLKQT